MIQLDLLVNLAGSRICQIRQEAASIIVDLDETVEGAICVICESTEFAHQTAEMMILNQLPIWHHARMVAWTDIVADYLVIAMESGNSFSLWAQSLRLERGV
jgi:hypothetical protein